MRPLLPVVLLLVGCAEPQRGEPAKPMPAATAQPEASAAAMPEGEQRTLVLDPSALSVDGDAVVYAPESNVKKATYEYYRFDKAAFVAKVGTVTPAAPVKVTVIVTSTKDETDQPKDPTVQAPIGGFVRRVHVCTLVSVEK